MGRFKTFDSLLFKLLFFLSLILAAPVLAQESFHTLDLSLHELQERVESAKSPIATTMLVNNTMPDGTVDPIVTQSPHMPFFRAITPDEDVLKSPHPTGTLRLCACACVGACLPARVCARACVFACVRACVCVSARARVRGCAGACMRLYVHACARACLRVRGLLHHEPGIACQTLHTALFAHARRSKRWMSGPPPRLRLCRASPLRQNALSARR